MGSYPGQELRAEADDGKIHLHGRVYIDPDGPTLFQVQVVGTQEVVDGPEAQAFLDAFEID